MGWIPRLMICHRPRCLAGQPRLASDHTHRLERHHDTECIQNYKLIRLSNSNPHRIHQQLKCPTRNTPAMLNRTCATKSLQQLSPHILW